jgi:hypothetical protein
MPLQSVGYLQSVDLATGAGSSREDLDAPTAWRQLLAADIVSSVDPNGLLTSITDTGGEIVCTAATLGGGNPTPSQLYVGRWNLINPDTGGGVTWSDGEFFGVQVWLQYGTNYPTLNREACYFGLNNGGTTALGAGLYYISGSQRVAGCTWTALANVAVTWTNANNIVWGDVSAPPQAGGTNILYNLVDAQQLDDATTPARVQSTVATSLGFATSASAVIFGAFSGNIDVKAYYRLTRAPTAPS